MKEEIWNKIIGFGNMYSVSNFNNVRNDATNKILKPRVTNSTRLFYLRENGKNTYFSINLGDNNVENLDGEIWKSISAYENYAISNFGRIKNLKFNKLLKKSLGQNGYNKITLHKNGKPTTFRVCRLVAQAFVLNPNNLPYVNHFNGSKTDDREKNLEWCTNQQNMDHAVRTGLANNKGENHNKAKLNDQQVIEIKNFYYNKIYSHNQLAKKYGVTSGTISRIILGRGWKHVENTPTICVGDINLNRKLTKEQVIEIKKLHSQGVSYYELAKKFNISHSNVAMIIKRKTWKNI